VVLIELSSGRFSGSFLGAWLMSLESMGGEVVGYVLVYGEMWPGVDASDWGTRSSAWVDVSMEKGLELIIDARRIGESCGVSAGQGETCLASVRTSLAELAV
jgi:hypothetical protein